MPQTRLYAFTDREGFEAFSRTQPGELFQNLRFVCHEKLYALIGHEPSTWPWQDRNQNTAVRLVHYHRVLGEATRLFPNLIPASFESVFEQAEALAPALVFHAANILPLLTEYGPLRQFTLHVRWDIPAMQQLLKNRTTESSLEKERRLVRDQFLLHLQGHLRDLIILNDEGGDSVFQAVLLMEASKEEPLAAILKKLDEECRGRLHINLLGPMPASSFARIEIRPPDEALIKQARQDLGLRPTLRLSEMKEAYRRKIQSLPSDTGQENSEMMSRLTHSYRYLTQIAEQQNLRHKNNPDKQWLRCDQRTLRLTPLVDVQRGITRWDDAVIKRN